MMRTSKDTDLSEKERRHTRPPPSPPTVPPTTTPPHALTKRFPSSLPDPKRSPLLSSPPRHPDALTYNIQSLFPDLLPFPPKKTNQGQE
ncbi:hypothetical protein E2C01_099371 [Portunus trituberculatus]|uniref:Uncharacterized protein n=1 Tax=Portunus trituberculatus TaxID=210409 RepID=A0A5B7K3N5_PORTR|nr:hypothetical protein [Portunus trituberculatus]